MHTQDTSATRPSRRDDDAIHFAVIAHLTATQSTSVDMKQLVCELADNSIPGADLAGLQAAIAALVGDGLLSVDGLTIAPTRAAVRMAELWGHR